MPVGRIRKSIPNNMKLLVFKRDNYSCQYCGKKGELIMRYAKPCVVENPKGIPLHEYDFYNGRDVIAFEIDHIVELFDGGTNDIDNLILSCRRCNRAKSNISRRNRRLNGTR